MRNTLPSSPPLIEKDNTRLDFYTVYKREATVHDTGFTRCDEDLGITLVFVRRLLPTPITHLAFPRWLVCSLQLTRSSFSMLGPDPNEQLAVSPHSPSHPQSVRCPVRNSYHFTYQETSSQRDRHRLGPMYASSLIGFIAMSNKQWLGWSSQRPSTKVRGESRNDWYTCLSRAFRIMPQVPPRVWLLPIHVVHQHPRYESPRHFHWSRSYVLHYNIRVRRCVHVRSRHQD